MPDTPGTLNFPTSLDTAVSLFEVSNRAYTTMTGSIGTGDLSIGVANGSLLPSTGAVTLVDSLTAPTKVEHIIYTVNSSNTLTVPAGGRGFGGSTAQTWSGTVYVRARALAQHHSVLRGGIIALETKLGINSSTPSSGTILRGTGAGASDWGALVNADVSASAAIALSKLAALTASRAVITDVSGVLSAAVTTSTEIGYLNGVTSAIQTQLDAKQAGDADLTAIAGLSPSNDDVIQRKAGAWTNRTPTQLTADLIAFTGDSGSGGVKGLVPAPASGDAAASKYLKADGTWATVSAGGSPGGSGSEIQYRSGASTFGAVTGSSVSGANVAFAGTITQTSASATAFESGPNGGTNPVFRLVNSTASSATGLSITGNAAGSGVTVGVLSSGTNENITLTPKGTGQVLISTSLTGPTDSNTYTGPTLALGSSTYGRINSGIFVVGGLSQFQVEVAVQSRVILGTSVQLNWTSTDSANASTSRGGADTGLARAAAGVIRATNGSTGAGTFSSAANTPAQITANQDNYTPGVGLFQRWSSDASRNVTGLAAGQVGQMAYIWNVGSFDIVLINESASSTAANRFVNEGSADITLPSNGCVFAQYDATSSRWRAVLL